ncbi:MAG: threonine--tRNA ligase [Alphaproteobacteria bacterium CG_4_9_14_3_um_filter_47_13]|nr:MAG: threonine--tRNA ligase [Alphaproteobacteria bacterium CG_4_9_14_3_um_filter_47_13]
MAEISVSSKNESLTVTFPDGSVRSYERGITGLEIAESIAKSLAKAAVAIEVDGTEWDLSRPLHKDCTVNIIKRESEQGLALIRHDTAHVMAQAVQELFPGTQVTIGPVIENGFFYDFGRKEPFSTDDLVAIEKKMHDIIDRGETFEREVWNRDDAIQYFKDKGEMFKAEIIADLPPQEDVSVYKQGAWLDLCRGPHMPTTKHIGHAFKLTKVAGAYWRGDSDKAMLTRIYGTAWRDEKELEAYLHMVEEAEKRDHRKLGKEMDLFHFQEEAQGSVFWHPKGFTIYNQLENYIRRRIHARGYVEVKTPQLIDNKLWEKSGHWGKFRENMFVVPDVVPNTDEEGSIFKEEPTKFMAIKPMNCPAHVQIFNQGIKSYRDLPIRMAEMGCCHRNEAHGALHGLMRVRQMTQDDAHIFCREDQILEEVKAFVQLFYEVYKDFGFEDIHIRLATRPEIRAGEDAIWDKAEQAMAEALETLGLAFEYSPGEGAFYGPKYEFHLKDAIGRSWQMGTCQLDFVLPARLDSHYIGEDGNKHHPVMIHRAIFGTFERFIGVLIESFGGKLPMWLAPVQCVIASITGDANDYAQKIYDRMFAQGLRVALDIRNEKINYKVREHSLAKVPVMFVVGQREADDNKVAIRRLGGKDQDIKSLDEAIETFINACKAPY